MSYYCDIVILSYYRDIVLSCFACIMCSTSHYTICVVTMAPLGQLDKIINKTFMLGIFRLISSYSVFTIQIH